MAGWRSCEGDKGAEGEAEQLDRVCNFESRWVLTTVSSSGAEGRWETVSQGRRGQMGDGFAREKRGR